ncbi:glycoside hydrolase family 31 protein [Coniochaeta ligniaria NRRL 30616]|uniref:alpha-glucosidase n=1 Tax=Coniochaeta ligniaria NRRL 30616 TaxID=1408157 RepID=A0A1J7JEW1_9PEZI|nr:glycoside hydrolase family 31 protein [Coniochaeta ligniaria NRRL 30616]
MVAFTSTSLALLAALWPSLGHTAACAPAPSGLATTTTTSWRAIFTVPSDADQGQNILPNVQDPQAVNVQDVCPGYTASAVTTTSSGFTANLDIAGPACNVYGNDIANLTLSVEYQAADRVHIQIQPRYIGSENETWFILPESIIPRPGVADTGAGAANSDLEVTWSNEPTFSFTVTRKSTSDVLFTTNGSVIVYADQFIEFGSPLPEDYNLYGLGEVIHGFRLGNNLTRTLFAADAGDPIDGNIYSTHPIYHDTRYFTQDSSGNLTYVANATDTSVDYKSYTHGVFNRNAHAQEIVLSPSNITWRALGGNIDLYFYSGPDAETLIKSYQDSMIGLPAMQQYWTLGFHQCRWGYQNWSVLQEVVDNFAKAELPLETIWTDIDYMNQYRDFENDQNTFGYVEGAKFLGKLHENHQHYVPIVDSAIYSPNPENASDAYPTYDRGVKADAFMFDAEGDLYVGAVWPGYTVFPDWVGGILNGTGTLEWWVEELALWYRNVSFDGIWIDMSEVSSFCVGPCGKHNLTLNPVHPDFSLPGEAGNLVLDFPEGFNLTNATEASSASYAASTQASPVPTGTTSSSSSVSTTSSSSTSTSSTSYLRTTPTPGVRNINYPPYAISNVQGDLAVHAVSPNATHHGGTLEYDFHNLNGHLILNATYSALLKIFPGLRPFIIGRSTFAGSGRVAGHWGGDNASKWAYMFFSIPQALTFSLSGIPMFGVDTCGFNGNSDMELCARWMQLSAFFPFYRNHNVLAAAPQEPYVWSAVADATRTAARIRYALLPYMYTLFARANGRGDTVMRALAWEFTDEPWLRNADRQFLLGPAVMVTPVLVQGADSVDGVFPGTGKGTVWYDWYNGSDVSAGLKAGENVTIAAPLGHIPLYVRGGYVLPLQEPGMTTYENRRNPWGVVVALDKEGKAGGELYLDDGESLKPEDVTWVEFSATNGSLAATATGSYVDSNPLANVTVLGVKTAPASVELNGKALEKSTWEYSTDSSVLAITSLNDQTSGGAWCSNWTITWT